MTGPSEHDLRAAIREFVFSDSWSESRWVLAMHPELLTDETDFLLSHIKATAREMGRSHDVDVTETHQKLLRLSRQKGDKAAFAELTGHDFPPLTADLIELCDAGARADESFRTTGDARQLGRAIDSYEAGLRSRTADLGRAPLETVEYVLSLAITLRSQHFEAEGRPDDLEAALAHWDALLRRASGSVTALSPRASGIGGTLLILAHIAGCQTLPAAVAALEHAVATGQPGADRDRSAKNLQVARLLAAEQ